MRISRFAICLLASVSAAITPAFAAPLSGEWNASVHVGAIDVPFDFGIALTGERASGWFFNGAEKVTSSSGSFHEGHLVLDFDSYAKRLDATLKSDGTLQGTYATTTSGSNAVPAPFHAQRPSPKATSSVGKIPAIAGLWLVLTQSQKSGEQAWHMIIRQAGAKVSAAILRVDGDTGALTGRWHEGKLVLSHFDGARPALIEVTLGQADTLQLVLHNSSGTNENLTAYRSADAQSKGLPQASDPATHTGVKDPNEPFHFSFPDLSGRTVSNTDARFRGKVLVVDVAGSWCPNCHDEAPFLQELYRKYQARGLEVVTLSFEDPEQYANPVRLRAFVNDFGLQYTVLLAGTTQQLHDKLPQAVNLDSYPTTFFIGRDGLVHGAHAGFAAPVTGDFNAKLKAAFAASIEKLLAEKAPSAQIAQVGN